MCLCWFGFFSYPISHSKEACKKRKKVSHVLFCLIQKEGNGKKSACFPHHQSTFALSDFRVCIINSWERSSVIGKILSTPSSSIAVQFCTTVITDKIYCSFPSPAISWAENSNTLEPPISRLTKAGLRIFVLCLWYQFAITKAKTLFFKVKTSIQSQLMAPVVQL